MNGHSRMRASTDFTAKARSMDLSDPTFSPPPEQAQRREADAKPHDHFSWKQGGEEGGERFGVILSRTCSSASQRFRANNDRADSSTTLQAAVRRAFSMKRSSSVREGYCRIHDTGDEDGGGELMEKQQQMRCSKKKKGKFLRACKRLFGF